MCTDMHSLKSRQYIRMPLQFISYLQKRKGKRPIKRGQTLERHKEDDRKTLLSCGLWQPVRAEQRLGRCQPYPEFNSPPHLKHPSERERESWWGKGCNMNDGLKHLTVIETENESSLFNSEKFKLVLHKKIQAEKWKMRQTRRPELDANS